MLGNELYERAMDAGMSVDAFWDSTAAEIDDYLESYKRKMMEAKKEEVTAWIHQARLNGECNPMANKSEYTMPWDIFPDLFAEEKKAHDQREFDNAMSRRRRAAAEHNQRRAMKNG